MTPVEAVVVDWRIVTREHPAHAPKAEAVVARVLAAEEEARASARRDGAGTRIAEVDAFAAALAAIGVQDPARAVYVLVPHSDIPVAQQVAGRGRDDVRPDAVVHRLADLRGVVDSWNA